MTRAGSTRWSRPSLAGGNVVLVLRNPALLKPCFSLSNLRNRLRMSQAGMAGGVRFVADQPMQDF